MVDPWRFMVQVVLFPLSRTTTGTWAILCNLTRFLKEPDELSVFPTGGGEVRRRFDSVSRYWLLKMAKIYHQSFGVFFFSLKLKHVNKGTKLLQCIFFFMQISKLDFRMWFFYKGVVILLIGCDTIETSKKMYN